MWLLMGPLGWYIYVVSFLKEICSIPPALVLLNMQRWGSGQNSCGADCCAGFPAWQSLRWECNGLFWCELQQCRLFWFGQQKVPSDHFFVSINGAKLWTCHNLPKLYCISEAKRFHDRLVNRFGLSLRIPISEYVHSEGPLVATFPYLAPKEVLKHLLLNGYSWLLLGGCHESNDDVEALLRSFWLCYQKEHPEHKVFEHPDRLGTTFPVTVHGDGGRTQKKQPLEVFSLQPVLGLNTAASMKSMACCCDTSVMYGGTDLGAPESQCLNSKHSTYLTHFLLFAYPSKAYSQFDNLLTGFLTEILDDLALCCQEGIVAKSGKTFYPGLHWVQIGHGMDVEGWNFNTFIPERWIRSWNTLLSRVWCWFTWCAVWGYQWWCALDCDQVQYSTVAAGAPWEEHPVWWWQTCQVSETWCISYFPNGDWKKLLGQLRFPSDLHGMFLGKEFEPFIDLVLLFIWAWLFCCLLPACCCLCHLRFPHWGWE